MNNLRLSKKLNVILKVLYLINLFCAIILLFVALIVWGNHNLSGIEFWVVTYGLAFHVFCWWLARTAVYAIHQNAKRLVEVEELLAQHGIEFPKTPVLELVSKKVMEFGQEQQLGTVKFNLENAIAGVEVEVKANAAWISNVNVKDNTIEFVVAANDGAVREAKITATYGKSEFNVAVKQAAYAAPAPVLEKDEVKLQSVTEVESQDVKKEVVSVINEVVVDSANLEKVESIEETEEEEFKRIDAEIDKNIKSEVVKLLSAGREMRAMLLLTDAGYPMDVAVKYIDNLKLRL